jgi:hypothetical protein
MKDKAWFHGSPIKIDVLKPGSTITRDQHLAEVFSHKPTFVLVSDDGQIQHNGSMPGFLYVIDEQVHVEDIYPHPATSMQPGQEWLTRREFKLKLVGPVAVLASEIITPEEISQILQKHSKTSADS